MSGQGRTGASAATAFFEAITSGDQERARSLLDDQPGLANSSDEQGLSPLIVATYWRRPGVVDLLLGRGAHDDVFAASARGDRLAVEMLLDAEPDAVNQHSVDGWTPLALAAHFGSFDVAQHLLSSGATVKTTSRNELANTALHSAVAGKQPEMADLLLRHGADPDATDAHGWTPLNIAAQSGQIEIVRRLLDAGADTSIANQDGKTPIDVARQEGHEEIVILLDPQAANAPA